MRTRLLSAITLAGVCAGCMPAQAPVATATAAAPAPVAPAAPPPRPMGPMPKFVAPSRNVSAVPSGTYMIEPAHTQVMFSVMHFGISSFYGSFSNASGRLTVDAKNATHDQLDVSVPIESVYTTSAKLTDELKSKGWFDAATYPTMSFKSTKVVPAGKGSAKITGDLTLHGVTKPVTLYATFNAAGMNPMMHKLNVGFTVTGSIKRSEFGISSAVPMVSDETKIMISAAFVQ